MPALVVLAALVAVAVEAVLVWADAEATDGPVEPTSATGFASTPPEPTIWAAATTAPATLSRRPAWPEPSKSPSRISLSYKPDPTNAARTGARHPEQTTQRPCTTAYR